jgi:hypothetical protein
MTCNGVTVLMARHHLAQIHMYGFATNRQLAVGDVRATGATIVQPNQAAEGARFQIKSSDQ